MRPNPHPKPNPTPPSHYLAIAAPILILLPFLNKAYHIDDPVYLWVAQHIQQHPLDFYGFTKNWSFFEEPMHAINKNPPGVSYFIALATAILGWREWTLHTVFLIPLLALSIGTYRLAQRFTQRPALATLAAMLAPVSLVSSSNVMSDTLTLALSVWAVVSWVNALETNRQRDAWIGMALLAMAILTKYLAVCFVPLLIAYALMRRAPAKTWAPSLAILALIVGAYLVWNDHLYDTNPLTGAASFAVEYEDAGRSRTPLASLVTGLAFAGGCYIVALFLVPVTWKPLPALAIVVLPAAILFLAQRWTAGLIHPAFQSTNAFQIQLIFFAIAAINLLLLAAADLRSHRNPDAAMLALWIAGFFIFSTFVNWTINGRTMLPMAPAVGILIARRIESLQRNPRDWRVIAPVSCATVIAVAVVWSDAALANAGRRAAQDFAARKESLHAQAWIQGNWGPSWYFEAAGALPFDSQSQSLKVGDVVIQSSNNLIYPLPDGLAKPIERVEFPAGQWLTTMDRSLGAGFYSSVWGPLPYAFGPVPNETYHYLRLDPQ